MPKNNVKEAEQIRDRLNRYLTSNQSYISCWIVLVCQRQPYIENLISDRSGGFLTGSRAFDGLRDG